MKLSFSELESLYDLVNEKYWDVKEGNWEAVKEEISELHLLMHKLLKLQKEQSGLHWPIVKSKASAEPKKFSFKTPTAITSKLLHTKEGDLRALRKCGELRRGYHYETGRSPKPSAIFYDLETTCRQLHDISWEEFSKPGFDIQANTHRKVERAFAKAREGMKK
ncbi:hypothetical protein [uncultured Mediterranean phage]|nr:hypothetical protein [uncultured Mediterranean phage]